MFIACGRANRSCKQQVRLLARLFESVTRRSVKLGIGYAVARQHSTSWHTKHMMITLKLLACLASVHALTPPKSHAAPTPTVRRRTAMRVRGGDNATDALRVRGGTGKKAKKPRKRGGRRWPTYGRSSRDRSRRESRVESKPADAPVVETPVAKDFNQLKEVPQGWIDRTCEEIKFRGASPTAES